MKQSILENLFWSCPFVGTVFLVTVVTSDAGFWWKTFGLSVAGGLWSLGAGAFLKVLDHRLAALQPGAAPPAPGAGEASTLKS